MDKALPNSTSGLYIEKGKLMKEGVEVAIDPTNVEQINFFAPIKKRGLALMNGVNLELHVVEKSFIRTDFLCACGHIVEIEAPATDKNDFSNIVGNTAHCIVCTSEYSIEQGENGLITKLL
jgi:hypothetical protein